MRVEDHLDVGKIIAWSNIFYPELIELAKSALLGPLISEHRPMVEEFKWGLEIIFQ